MLFNTTETLEKVFGVDISRQQRIDSVHCGQNPRMESALTFDPSLI
jgi:hypothetical protein